MLRQMTRLETLCLQGVGLNGPTAMRALSAVVPMLEHLRRLAIHGNRMGPVAAMVLAHCMLPASICIEVSVGNELVAVGDNCCVLGTIADMNRVAGRKVFR